MERNEEMERYFSGRKLYGDDFTLGEIEAWYNDEKEAYSHLVDEKRDVYRYDYHALNQYHGYRHLRGKVFQHVLGIGSAYGEEFRPIASQIQRLTILEPSEAFQKTEVCGIPATYIKPRVEGTMPFEDRSFDLIVCLGALHHIPNVSHVVGELFRCLQPAGFALIREPVVSMGDWRKPRQGLSKHERGIPRQVFSEIIQKTGFTVVRQSPCVFRPVPIL